MSAVYHRGVLQGSDEWHAARCGLLTASEMRLIVTPTMKAAANDKERSHLYELLAQRITRHVEPSYISDDMLRGREDEIDACIAYGQHHAIVDAIGFVTNDKWGFTIGYSPDGMVGADGLVECKSRRQKYQVQTIVECVAGTGIPAEYLIQVQTGLLVSERAWCDFVSYSGGLPMAVIRVFPDPVIADAIVAAATAFEARLADARARFDRVATELIPTERKILQEIF